MNGKLHTVLKSETVVTTVSLNLFYLMYLVANWLVEYFSKWHENQNAHNKMICFKWSEHWSVQMVTDNIEGSGKNWFACGKKSNAEPLTNVIL